MLVDSSDALFTGGLLGLHRMYLLLAGGLLLLLCRRRRCQIGGVSSSARDDRGSRGLTSLTCSAAGRSFSRFRGETAAIHAAYFGAGLRLLWLAWQESSLLGRSARQISV